MKNTYLVTFRAPLQEKDREKTKTQLLNQTQKAPSCSFLSLFALYLKGKKKEIWYLNQPVDGRFAFI